MLGLLVSILSSLWPAMAGAQPRLSRVPRPYDVRSYRLVVRLDAASGTYKVNTTIHFVATAAMTELELDAVDLKVGGAWLLGPPVIGGGRPIVEGAEATDDDDAGAGKRSAPASMPIPALIHEKPLDEVQGTLVLTLPVRLLPGSEATVEVETSGTARKDANGLFVVHDPEYPRRGPIYLTHFEPLGARRFFPCHDDPADKATFDVTIETDAKLVALANGRKMEDGRADDRRLQRVRYSMALPMSTYLLALAIGPFDHDALDDGGVPLDGFLHRGRKDAAAFALHTAQEVLDSFASQWDFPYPFPRYGQVEAPFFPSAAMASSSLTLSSRAAMVLPTADAQLGKLRIAGTVAHALAHQWFGDLVTMRWWDDVWLNESLATYAAGRFLAEKYGGEAIAVRTTAELHDSYFRVEDGPRSHPIMNRELASLEDAFDAITYTKGAQVLRMIEELLGQDRLRAGLSAYLRLHAYKNATGADLLAALGEAQRGGPAPRRGGAAEVDTPVQEFAKSWLEARGHPVLTVSARYDVIRRQTLLSVRQRPNHPADSALWHVRLPVSLHRRDAARYDVDTTVVLDGPAITLAMPTPAAPEWVSWNRGGLALVEIEAPGTLESAWALAAQSDPDGPARLLALLQLARPALVTGGDLGKLSPVGEAALVRALEEDPLPQVRYQIALRLARAPGVLKPRLTEAALALSRAPQGIDPEDSLGVVMVRAGGIELLGRAPGAEAGHLLADLVQDDRVPVDLLAPAAVGLMRRGDEAALAALDKGAQTQKGRGFVFGSRVLGAYGALGDPKRLGEVVRVIREHVGERSIVSEILRGLFYNDELRRSPELPAAIAELVLGSPQLDEDQQARALEAMEGLRTKEARMVLQAVKQRARAARIRILANLFLQQTFG